MNACPVLLRGERQPKGPDILQAAAPCPPSTLFVTEGVVGTGMVDAATGIHVGCQLVAQCLDSLFVDGAVGVVQVSSQAWPGNHSALIEDDVRVHQRTVFLDR